MWGDSRGARWRRWRSPSRCPPTAACGSPVSLPKMRSPASPRPGADVAVARRARGRSRRSSIGDLRVRLAQRLARPRARRPGRRSAAAARPRASAARSPATPLPPVASIGSTTNTSASATPGGHVLVVADRPQRLLVAVHAEVPDARLGHRRRKPVDHARARRAGSPRSTISSASRTPARGLERRLDLVSSARSVAHRLVGEDHRGVAQRLAEHAVRRVAVAQDREQAAQQRVVDDRDASACACARNATSVGARGCSRAATSSSRRVDPDPERTLARLPARSAPRTAGVLASATPTSARRTGRLKLREQEPGGATLIAVRPRRTRADGARERATGSSPVADPGALRAALDAALGDARGGREGAPPAAVGERAHPPRRRRRASARFVELEAVAAPDSDLAAEHEQVDAPARGARHRDERSCADSLRRPAARPARRADSRAARARDGARAYAPYSQLPRRRRAARRRTARLRRRQRRERRLPAGPVRGGVGDRRAGRRRAARGSPRSR